MAKWAQVAVQSSQGFCFPSLCPSCLRPKPEAHLRVRSERGRLIGFYLVATKWEHLWVTVPFCGECADRRKRWERRDTALLLIAAIASLAFAAWLAAMLSLPAWAFWGVFLLAALISTTLCNRIVSDYRAVRIERHGLDTVTFRFSHSEYAQEFAQLNGQAGQVPDSSLTA